jgi:hypothetical protein
MKQDQSLKNKSALSPYKIAIARYIRSAMVLQDKRYDDLVRELEQIGIYLTADNLRSKISKGMFSADMLAAIIDVLGIKDDAMREIMKQVHHD